MHASCDRPPTRTCCRRRHHHLQDAARPTVRFFDRKGYYTVHGDDALYVARTFYKTTAVVRYYGAEGGKVKVRACACVRVRACVCACGCGCVCVWGLQSARALQTRIMCRPGCDGPAYRHINTFRPCPCPPLDASLLALSRRTSTVWTGRHVRRLTRVCRASTHTSCRPHS
jgi:hypothetical protein